MSKTNATVKKIDLVIVIDTSMNNRMSVPLL